MNETERWVEQTRRLLRNFVHAPRPSSLDPLLNHMRGLDLPEVLGYLGCGDACTTCSWGDLGGFHLRETCSMVAFLESMHDARANERSPLSLQPEALALLGVLEKMHLATAGPPS